jgi:NAD(P)-dependent dehydrogenase (short-subunit alcohol dehydrogenase family)
MKTLIVTGGTGGLGETVVRRLSRTYRCVLLYHSTAPDAAPNVEGLKADLNDESSIRAAMTQVDEPYGLVHLAGGYAGGTVSETTTETWQRMIGLNLTSTFFVVRESLARMKRGQPGRIVAISSEASTSKFASAAAYTISKAGLNTLIELTAAELGGTGITANALLPGSLDTPATRKAMPNAKLVSLDRVTDTIEFLLSDAAANITGALIPLKAS